MEPLIRKSAPVMSPWAIISVVAPVRAIAWAWLVGLGLSGSPLAAQQPEPPQLSYASPLGVQRGAQLALTLAGKHLAAGGKLWTSLPVSTPPAVVAQSDTLATASLQLPEVQAAIAKGRPLIAGFDSRAETTVLGGIGLPRA